MVYKRLEVDQSRKVARLERRPGGGLGAIEALLNRFGLGDRPDVYDMNVQQLKELLSWEEATVRDSPSSGNAKDGRLNIAVIRETLKELGSGDDTRPAS